MSQQCDTTKTEHKLGWCESTMCKKGADPNLQWLENDPSETIGKIFSTTVDVEKRLTCFMKLLDNKYFML